MLLALQKLLAQRASASSGVLAADRISFDDWRAYRDEVRTADAPKRFVDGEFVEAFLELPEPEQVEIVAGLQGWSVDAVRDAVAGLRMAH